MDAKFADISVGRTKLLMSDSELAIADKSSYTEISYEWTMILSDCFVILEKVTLMIAPYASYRTVSLSMTLSDP